MGAWQEIVDYTWEANETERTFSNFGGLSKDDFYKIHLTVVNPTGSNAGIYLFADNTTAADYTRQVLVGTGTTAAAAREANNNLLASTRANTTSSSFAYIKLSQNDVINYFSNSTERNDSSLETRMFYSTSDGATFPSGVSTLKLFASVSGAIGTGSRIQIYKLAAEKVADITVESNTTQVDISSLSIDKDSEYLLVSDLIPGGDMFLYVNDNTTATGFYSQRIEGNGSSASAGRTNNSRYMDGSSNRGLAYSHIKLSNIGAYTSQNYSIRESGTSGIRLQNRFVSSTAENITSITKLNVVCSLTNGIPTGSRFTLYKLYE